MIFARIRRWRTVPFPVVEFAGGYFSIRVVVDDPAAYLGGWAAELERLADEYEAAQPVPFVPTAATS